MELQRSKQLVEKHRETILEVERYLWRHPETGFREWNTSAYLAKIFEEAGYELTMAGNIPGFYTDLDTGRPGPKILILGELDCLLQPNHPEAVDGKAHACGHNAQCAALVGVALALKEPGALDGLCGSIRLMAVPAEELIEVEYRNSLRDQGIIRYLGGKVEFLHRGYMDGCDMAFLFHATSATDADFDCYDSNGCMTKEITFQGVSAHAGGSPHMGVNALYAASMGLQAINAIRETFLDGEHVRVHPIITKGGGSVNTIPDEAKISTYVRGATMESMLRNNKKVTRALAGAALSLGAGVRILDRPGYAPLLNDPTLKQVAGEVAQELFGPERVNMNKSWGCGSTDMGDLSCVMPTLHPHIGGCTGKGHGDDYCVADPEKTCVQGAVLYLMLTAALLENDAARAKEVLAKAKLRYPSKEAYFEAIDQFTADRNLIAYDEDGARVTF